MKPIVAETLKTLEPGTWVLATNTVGRIHEVSGVSHVMRNIPMAVRYLDTDLEYTQYKVFDRVEQITEDQAYQLSGDTDVIIFMEDIYEDDVMFLDKLYNYYDKNTNSFLCSAMYLYE